MNQCRSKVCFKCGEDKPIDDFYRHPEMADGHLNKCKECTKRDVRSNRESNIEYYREYDKIRFNTNERRKQHDRSVKKHRRENPEKYKARTALGNALRDGKISKPKACEVCGDDGQLHGHHHDYSEPLEVTWVCQKCHTRIHHESN
jgi:hypothetical protein